MNAPPKPIALEDAPDRGALAAVERHVLALARCLQIARPIPDALRLHHDKRLAQIAALCDEPRHAFELLPRLFKRELDSFQTRFAMGEVIAHLNHLWQAGHLRRLPGQDGVIRFTQP